MYAREWWEGETKMNERDGSGRGGGGAVERSARATSATRAKTAFSLLDHSSFHSSTPPSIPRVISGGKFILQLSP